MNEADNALIVMHTLIKEAFENLDRIGVSGDRKEYQSLAVKLALHMNFLNSLLTLIEDEDD